MTTRVLQSERDRADLVKLIGAMKLPCTVNITKGRRRSADQNRLQRLWLNEAAEQLQDESAEDKRAYCKLHFGVPILRAENEEFREAYDRIIRPHSYEDKLAMMRIPLDFPCTRLMTAKQKKQYLDEIWIHFTALGVQLTDPDALGLGRRAA